MAITETASYVRRRNNRRAGASVLRQPPRPVSAAPSLDPQRQGAYAMIRLTRLVSSVLILLFGAAPLTAAQTATGSIAGRVTDSERPCPDAHALVVLVGT